MLRGRGEWRCSHTAKRDNEFSPPNVDCHVTLLWGSYPSNGEDDFTLSEVERTMLLRCKRL